MKIKIIMQSGHELLAMGPDEKVIDAVHRMVERRCGSVLITDADGEMLGIFTERDLLTRIVQTQRVPAATCLREVMSTEIYTATPEDDVREVRREMDKRHIRHLPVMEDGRVRCVLSTRDLVRASLSEVRDEAQAMSDYIRGVE